MTLAKIEDPSIEVLIGPKSFTFNPYPARDAINAAETVAAGRVALAKIIGVEKLSTARYLALCDQIHSFVRKVDEIYQSVELNAELLISYNGAISLDRMLSMTNLEKLAFLNHGRAREAATRLNFMADISAVVGKNGAAHRAELALIAFANDEDSLAKYLELISRK